MSERPAQRPPTSGGAAAGGPATDEVVVRAGCGRTRGVSAAEVARAGASAAFAYLALDYPECPTCPHRVDPEGAASFCTWRPVDAPHPFAALAGWEAPT